MPSSGSTDAPSEARTIEKVVDSAGRIGERGAYVDNVRARVASMLEACRAS